MNANGPTTVPGTDSELAALLRDEELIERQLADKRVEQAQVENQRAAADWSRMTTTIWVTNNADLKARFFRLYENDRHQDDVAYWKFNYAQSQMIARTSDKRIAKLERKLLKAQIKLAKQRVFDLEVALDRMENPYG